MTNDVAEEEKSSPVSKHHDVVVRDDEGYNSSKANDSAPSSAELSSHNDDDDEIRANIESALQILTDKRTNFYEHEKDAGVATITDNQHDVVADENWDEIFETVERFSHNALTLMSWIEEYKDVHKMKFDPESRKGRSAVDERLENVASHARRLYAEVKRDAGKLALTLGSERAAVNTIMANVKKHYACVKTGWLSPDDGDSGCASPRWTARLQGGTAATDGSLEPYESFRPKLTSTPAPQTPRRLKQAAEVTTKTRGTWLDRVSSMCTPGRTRIWSEFLREYDDSQARIASLSARVAIAADIFPICELRVAYEQYRTDVRRTYYEGNRDLLRAMSDCVSELYPDLRRQARTLMAEVEDGFERLDFDIKRKMEEVPRHHTVLSRRRPSLNSPATSSPRRDEDWVRRELAGRRSIEPDPFAKVPLSDFSLNQIRDKLDLFDGNNKKSSSSNGSKGGNRRSIEGDGADPRWSIAATVGTRDGPMDVRQDRKSIGSSSSSSTDQVCESHPTNNQKSYEDLWRDDDAQEELLPDPYQLAHDVTDMHKWLQSCEKQVYDAFCSKSIGWDPIRLRNLLEETRRIRDEMERRGRALHRCATKTDKFLARRHRYEFAARKLNADDLCWSALMLKQRFLTLGLFAVDVECLLERRLDVTAVVHKGVKMDELRHPADNLWHEKPLAVIGGDDNDDDYDVIVAKEPARDDESAATSA